MVDESERNRHSETYIDEVIDDRTEATNTQELLRCKLKDWHVTAAYASRIERLLACNIRARILDLACGTGDVTIMLGQRGYDMIGLDCTPAMLSVALELSRRKPNHVKWVCADMRTIEYSHEMDYVLLRDVIFSFFKSKEDDSDLIARISRALKPGGLCLFEVYNKEFGIKHGVQNVAVYDPAMDVFVAKPPHSMKYALRLYTETEWKHLLFQSGLAIVRRDGWRWNGDPEPPPWRADFIVAKKV